MRYQVYKLTGILTAVLLAPAAFADDPPKCGDLTVEGGALCSKSTSNSGSFIGSFKTISDTLIFVVGAVAVIMLIVGGLRYVISQGDAAAVKQAKDTILYAIIGIIVAILAFAIVQFVALHVGSNP